MAEIVLGMASSHTPMLLADDDVLPLFAEWDQKVARFDKEGNPTNYTALLEKADPGLEGLVTKDQMLEKLRQARQGMARLRSTLAKAKLDALIVVGDDQNESYKDDNRPVFAIYWGETIRNKYTADEGVPEWFAKIRARYFEAEDARDYPVHKGLGLHLIQSLLEADFDIASSARLPEDDGEGHAVAFVHKWLMDESNPVPVVPVLLNTYFPPNQPRPSRCYDLGKAMRAAVESFGEGRIGIIASGGLSHFLVDEDFDRRFIRALQEKDAKYVAGLPANKLKAGSSEMLNWVCLAGATEHLPLSWVDYIPGYRTPAGTGTGISFAEWRK